MARRDDITGKVAMSGNNRSHAMNSSKRKFNLNLRKITIVDANGQKKKYKVTARTARTIQKNGGKINNIK